MDIAIALTIAGSITSAGFGTSALVWKLQRFMERRERAIGSIWREIGERYGLEFIDGPKGTKDFRGLAYTERRLRGTHRGASIDLRRIARSYPPIVGRIAFEPALSVPFALTQPASADVLWRTQTGAPAFDRRFTLQSREPTEAVRMMTPKVRAAILEMVKWCPDLQLDDSGLGWTLGTDLTDFGRLSNTLDAAMETTSALIDASEALFLPDPVSLTA